MLSLSYSNIPWYLQILVINLPLWQNPLTSCVIRLSICLGSINVCNKLLYSLAFYMCIYMCIYESKTKNTFTVCPSCSCFYRHCLHLKEGDNLTLTYYFAKLAGLISARQIGCVGFHLLAVPSYIWCFSTAYCKCERSCRQFILTGRYFVHVNLTLLHNSCCLLPQEKKTCWQFWKGDGGSTWSWG